MQRQVVATIAAGMLMALGLGSSSSVQAAAPAPSSYIGVEKTISSIRDSWSRPGAVADPNAPGWNVFFDALLNDLHPYSQADNSTDRLMRSIAFTRSRPHWPRFPGLPRSSFAKSCGNGCGHEFAWRGPSAG